VQKRNYLRFCLVGWIVITFSAPLRSVIRATGKEAHPCLSNEALIILPIDWFPRTGHHFRDG
jgi:Na+-driven multidrug efflux pump